MDPIRQWLRAANHVAALTGAGISAESGVPTFRGDGGLWKHYRAEDLATPQAFARDPRLVWEWYDWRRQRIARANPNPGHRAIAEFGRVHPSFRLITQNVDGLHDRAGSHDVLHLHGDIWLLRCTSCGRQENNRQVPLPELPPRCGCGGLFRPGVVWFGEALPLPVWLAAEKAARQAEVFLVVGTSAVVYPAADLVRLAKSAGARVVEINPDTTPISGSVDCSLRGKAGEILPRILAPD